jgi:hypothetical protein
MYTFRSNSEEMYRESIPASVARPYPYPQTRSRQSKIILIHHSIAQSVVASLVADVNQYPTVVPAKAGILSPQVEVSRLKYSTLFDVRNTFAFQAKCTSSKYNSFSSVVARPFQKLFKGRGNLKSNGLFNILLLNIFIFT